MRQIRLLPFIILSLLILGSNYIQAQSFKRLYENIALNSENNLWKIEVFPGGNPSDIEFSYEYADQIEIMENGNLKVKSAYGDYIEPAPVAWQEHVDGKRKRIQGKYVLKGNKIKMEFGTYEMAQVLVIDISGLSRNFLYFFSEPLAYKR